MALDGFNWELEQGVYGLLGPNGAGKSTLLEILSLNLMPTSGKILWDGRDIHSRPGKFRSILGYLPQDYGFYPELRVKQVLNYLGNLNGLFGKKMRIRMEEVLNQVNMISHKRRKVKSLSGGMRQRLAIAQALLHKPKLMIIDEPTTGLDPGERVTFRNLLFDLGKECIVFLSTHIVKDVEFSCQKMTLLYGGVQRFTGLPSDFIKRARGRVLEKTLPYDEFRIFLKENHVVSIQEGAEGIRMRYIIPPGKNGHERGAEEVKPNLEDAYVDFIRECREEPNATVAG